MGWIFYDETSFMALDILIVDSFPQINDED